MREGPALKLGSSAAGNNSCVAVTEGDGLSKYPGCVSVTLGDSEGEWDSEGLGVALEQALGVGDAKGVSDWDVVGMA